jgi:DNA-binding response OmpR family regulator
MTIYDQAEKEMAALQKEFLARNDVPRLMVIDDDKIYGDLVAAWIAPLNWVAEIYLDAEQAFAVMQSKKYDLVWLDLKMPKMNGVEFVSRLQTLKLKAPPIIIVTGIEVSSPVRSFLRECGVLMISDKPTNAAQLRELLEMVNPKTMKEK